MILLFMRFTIIRTKLKNDLQIEHLEKQKNEELNQIKQPTLLIWGNNDTITPPFVGREFHRLIPNSELHFIDKCGHAPMMEVPNEFNVILAQFLQKLETTAAN